MSESAKIIKTAKKQIRTGHKESARNLLRPLLDQEPFHEEALLLYSFVAGTKKASLSCVERILEVNPQHKRAQRRLAQLQNDPSATIPPPKTAVIPKSPFLYVGLGLVAIVVIFLIGSYGYYSARTSKMLLPSAPPPVDTQSVFHEMGYPTPKSRYINDYIRQLDEDEANQIRHLLVDLNKNTGIEVRVVIINSMNDYIPNSYEIEPFATDLFNYWGIGDAQRNDGIMILVARRDRQMRIELGAGYGHEYNDDMQKIIDRNMLPHFRREDYKSGIYEGVLAVVNTFDRTALTSLAALPTTIYSLLASVVDSILWLLTLSSCCVPFTMVGAVGGGYSLTRYRKRYKTRPCKRCHSPMKRLDEHQDDAYLEPGQVAEEELGTVDYDIWLCQNCDEFSKERYPALFRKGHKCSNCDYQTAEHKQTTITAATYTATGKARIDISCQHCNHRSEQEKTLPILTHDHTASNDFSSGGGGGGSSFSSGSSGFSGGSSSGGGASGSW